VAVSTERNPIPKSITTIATIRPSHNANWPAQFELVEDLPPLEVGQPPKRRSSCRTLRTHGPDPLALLCARR